MSVSEMAWGNGDTFSRLASFVAEQRAYEQDPILIYEPDCMLMASRYARLRIRQALNDAGATPEQFNEELARRTTPKWAYLSGLLLEEQR